MNDIQRRKKEVWWLAAFVVLFFLPDELFNYIEVENSTSWEGRRNCEAEMSAARERCGKLDEMQRTYGSHVLLLRTSCSQPSSTLSGRPSSSQLCSKVERGTL